MTRPEIDYSLIAETRAQCFVGCSQGLPSTSFAKSKDECFGKVSWSRERATCCSFRAFVEKRGLFYLASVTLVSLLDAKKRGH